MTRDRSKAEAYRAAVRSVACPQCGAGPDQQCLTDRGAPRISNHAVRQAEANMRVVPVGQGRHEQLDIPKGAIICPDEGVDGWLVYGVMDRSRQRFGYVGQTGNLIKRVKGHGRDVARGGMTRKRVRWMSSVIRAGGVLEFVVLERCQSQVASLEAESRWISKLAGEGHDLHNRWREHQQLIAMASGTGNMH